MSYFFSLVFYFSFFRDLKSNYSTTCYKRSCYLYLRNRTAAVLKSIQLKRIEEFCSTQSSSSSHVHTWCRLPELQANKYIATKESKRYFKGQEFLL